jgi:hypothetical protein
LRAEEKRRLFTAEVAEVAEGAEARREVRESVSRELRAAAGLYLCSQAHSLGVFSATSASSAVKTPNPK